METDERFLERMRDEIIPLVDENYDRLLALARRGAAVQWRPIAEAEDEKDSGAPILAKREGAIGHCIMWWGPRDGVQYWMYSNMGQQYIGDPTHFIPLSALATPETKP